MPSDTPVYIKDGADNVNLGSAVYGGATDFVISKYASVEGYGYGQDGITGDTAIYSGVGGITLTGGAFVNIEAQNGYSQKTLDGTSGAGGIGVNLDAADTFYNNGIVRGGRGGSYYFYGSGVRPANPNAGAGGDGISLSHGAYLSNAFGAAISGGLGGGTFYTTPGGNDQLYDTGQSAPGVEVAGGRVTNGGSILGGGIPLSDSAGGAGVQLDAGSTANYLNNTTGTITGGSGFSGGAGVNLVAYNKGAYQQGSTTTLAPGTIYNQGQITGGAGSVGIGGDGIDVANDQGFTNTGYNTDLDNTGSVNGGDGAGGGGIGVRLGDNDVAYSGGTIQGGNATSGNSAGGAGVSVNSGTFFSTSGGTLAGGTGYGSGSGGTGVYVAGSGASVDLYDTTVEGGAGGASGVTGDAVQFAATGSGDLSIFANDTFIGQVAGAAYTADDTLSLNGSGTLGGGFGTQFTGFTELSFAPGASWTVDASGAGLQALDAHEGAISGLSTTDTIDVTDVPFSSITSSNFLSIGSGEGFLSFDTNSGFYETFFDNLMGGNSVQVTSDGGTGTDITVVPTAACYLRGTRIRTTRGEVPIEALSVSDHLVCSSGNSRPVRWLGHRSIDCSRYPQPGSVWPICIRAGALREQQPLADLWVSPGHSVLVEGVLIQAEQLVNGVTIVQVPRQRVEYWHVELDAHDLLIAEGMAAESYLDTGNRTAFVNGGRYLEAFPDFRAKHWSETCVPLVMDGPALHRARERVLQRAHELGYAVTHDTDVHVLADDQRIEPMPLAERRIAFAIPAGCRSIELRCRTFVPWRVVGGTDVRELGLCVGRLQIDGNDWALDDEQKYAHGWHGLERSPAERLQRWSSGRTPLPSGTRLLVIDVAGRSYYWQEPERAMALCI